MPFGTTRQFMVNQVQPTAGTFWDAVRFESRLMEDGTVAERNVRPESHADWQAVEQAATRLVEYAEVLQTASYAEGRGHDWLVYARGLSDVAARARRAAAAKDPDAVFKIGGTLYNVCRACHQMYPPEVSPESIDDVEAG
jgi:hypothetical protein